MKVLVTGGAGFLGPHIAAELTRSGHQVVVFDQREPSFACEFVKGNLTSLEDVLKAVRGINAICHLGGVGDVYLAFEEPFTAAAANVVGTSNIAEAAHRYGIQKVVYASTWEVYGHPQYQPIDEDHPCHPDHPYNITKLGGEQMLLAYDHLKGVPAVALRLGTAYGRGMRPNSVFSIFVTRAMKGEQIVINGGGTQARQFTHTSDIARAFRLALESDLRGEAFNIVSSENISIRQLAEMVCEQFPTQLVFNEARAGDVPSAIVSAEKAGRLLGWRAEMNFRDGLADLIDSHRHRD